MRNFGSVGKLSALVNCRNLIVRFGCEGLIYYRGLQEKPDLYFEQAEIEGTIFARHRRMNNRRTVRVRRPAASA